MSNQELTKELQKPLINKSEKRKVHLSVIGNTWNADLASIQLKCKLIQAFVFCYVLII